VRKIRSYVRRESRFTASQKKAFEQYWPKYGLTLQNKLNLNELFGRTTPKILEIGFGDGEALLEMALASPEKDYIGVEVYRPGVSQLLSGIEKHQLQNIRIFCHDGTEVLENAIEDNSLEGVLLFFADPWPKTRHQKRRIIQSNFIQEIVKKLKIGGIVHLATDWENYAEHMMNVLTEEKTLKNLAGLKQFSERPDSRPLTKYERRGNRLGHSTWDLIFEKVSYTNNKQK
jgi:tRNA (guanine-N7-)-methyltransferase